MVTHKHRRAVLATALISATIFCLATHTVADQFCIPPSGGGADAIPDGSGSLAREIVVTAPGGARAITNVRVSLVITHPWVGDLRVVLRHPSGLDVVLLDRPGYPSLTNFPGPWGCGADGIDVQLDDAFLLGAESTCELVGTAISGERRPLEQLVAFDSLEPAGTWTLIVSDLVPIDAGTLGQVCLDITSVPRSICPGDLNGSNTIDGSDLATLLGAWGSSCVGCPADVDGDGTIGGTDLAILLGAWGNCPG